MDCHSASEVFCRMYVLTYIASHHACITRNVYTTHVCSNVFTARVCTLRVRCLMGITHKSAVKWPSDHVLYPSVTRLPYTRVSSCLWAVPYVSRLERECILMWKSIHSKNEDVKPLCFYMSPCLTIMSPCNSLKYVITQKCTYLFFVSILYSP